MRREGADRADAYKPLKLGRERTELVQDSSHSAPASPASSPPPPLGFSHVPQPLTALVEARIAAGAVRVPMLPRAASQLLTLDPAATVPGLEALVDRDHALTAHVMRIASSATLAGHDRLRSLRQALGRLGGRLLREVVIVAAVSDHVMRLPGYDPELRALWRHALRTALWTKEVAAVRGGDGEEAFFSGLLVDVGRAAAFRLVVETSMAQGRRVDPGLALATAERLATPVGTLFVETWGLPERLRAVVAAASRPHLAGRYLDLVLTVGLGRWLAACTDAERSDLHAHAALKVLALTCDDVRAILRRARRVDELVETLAL